jgi:hypothetical protein
MLIRFISTLTEEDEHRLAEVIVDTAKALLAHSPIGYILRVETTDAKLFELNQVAPSAVVTHVAPPRQPRATAAFRPRRHDRLKKS